jgi:hypothetical protein
MADTKFSQFAEGGNIQAGDIAVGLRDGVNTKFTAIPSASANTASTIVQRDGSGNFSAGTITASLNGTASTVTTIPSLSGDVSNTGNDVTVDTVGGSTAANIHTAELLANAATNTNTVSTIVKRDGSGNFSAGTITGAQLIATTQVTTDTIVENTAAAGVTIDSVLLKDNGVHSRSVYVDAINSDDDAITAGQIVAFRINENSSLPRVWVPSNYQSYTVQGGLMPFAIATESVAIDTVSRGFLRQGVLTVNINDTATGNAVYITVLNELTLDVTPWQVGTVINVISPTQAEVYFNFEWIGAGSKVFNNNGVSILDSSLEFYRTFKLDGTLMTANRTLTFDLGDTNRTLTMTGDAALNQDVTTTGTPSFSSMFAGQINSVNNGLRILNNALTYTLSFGTSGTMTDNRNLNFNVSDANKVLTMTGDATLNQDVSTAGSPQFLAVTASNTGGLNVRDLIDAFDLKIRAGENYSANRELTYYNDNASRVIYQYGDVVLSQSIITDATTARTGILTDANGWIRFTNAANMTFTIPHSSTVSYPQGTVIYLSNKTSGTGVLSLALAASVTLESTLTLANVAVGSGGYIGLKLVGSNTWELIALYESVAATLSTGGAISASWTTRFTRNMKELLFTWDDVAGTFTGAKVTATLPHARFYPSMVKNYISPGRDNGVASITYMTVSTGGAVSIGSGVAQNNFAAGAGGCWGSSFAWNVA